jgi:hypothetical protein
MKRFALALALLAAPRIASAHLMPEGQGSAHLVGNRAYVLLSVSAKALAAFDDDHDGRLSKAELGQHGDAITATLKQRVRFFSDSIAGRVAWQTISIEHADDPDAPVAAITLVRVDEWDRPLTSIRIATDLASTAPNGRIEFRGILGEQTQVDTLSAARSELTFFTPKPAPIRRIDAGLLALLVAAITGLVVSRYSRWPGWRNRSAPEPSPR